MTSTKESQLNFYKVIDDLSDDVVQMLLVLEETSVDEIEACKMQLSAILEQGSQDNLQVPAKSIRKVIDKLEAEIGRRNVVIH